MWIKLCLLLVYICFLFLLSRLLETISWCDLSTSCTLSRQLLDPMRLSVAKLKCLLDHRGVSYEGVVEKSELTNLVEASGAVVEEDVNVYCKEVATTTETNFTSGAHFIEQVEDAKDSVWLVQVVTHTDQVQVLMNHQWRNIHRKSSYLGVRTGLLDCSLDKRYCNHRGWRVPVLLLALPSVYAKKASVEMHNYTGLVTANAVMRWIHEKLDSRIKRYKDGSQFKRRFELSSLNPELQAILFSQAVSVPLFFSALSVKFPGRVKFGLVSSRNFTTKKTFVQRLSGASKINHLPMFVIYTTERNYTFGLKPGERFTFSSMELFLKFLHPCLNDIFIISFCITNLVAWFELFVSNCGLFKRMKKFVWCLLKYNIMVIILWLPIIGLFQMPYLDQVPLVIMKLHRIFTISDFGALLRGDFVFFLDNPIYVYFSFVLYLISVTLLCKRFREFEDDTDEWFNFRQMQTLTHLRANDLFDPMRTSSHGLVGGFQVFGSRFSQQSLWLQPSIPLEYIQHLPTWRYSPQTMASRASQNVAKIESDMVTAHSLSGDESTSQSHNQNRDVSSGDNLPTRASTAMATNSCNQNSLTHGETTASERHCQLPDCTVVGHRNSTDPENSCFSSAVLPNTISHPICDLNSEIQKQSSLTKQTQPDILPNGFRQGFMESLQCVICLEEYVPLTMLCGLPCGHVFHESCIITWLNREKHFCPMCRWPSFKLMASETPP